MPRAYNTHTVALAIDADPKWLDNLLSHSPATDFGARQGVARQIAPEMVTALYIARALATSLDAARAPALEIGRLLTVNDTAELCAGITLSIDREAISRTINQRLFDAVQASPPKKRGRPRKRSGE